MVLFPSRAIVKYELVSTLRTIKSFVFVLAFVGALFLVSVYSWPEDQMNPHYARMASWQFVRAVTWTLFWVCLLFVPAYAAGAIIGEKERGSFDMLRITLIHNSGIIAGKFINAVGFFGLLFVALLPVFSTVLFLVGVDTREIIMAYGLIFATASACAMVGILSSTLFERGFAAVAGAYVGVLALMLGPALIVLFVLLVLGVFGSRNAIDDALAISAMIASPFYTLRALVSSQGMPAFAFVLSMVYHALFIGVCYVMTLRVLRRPPRAVRVPAWKPIDSEAALKRRREEWPFYLIDPMRRKKPIEDGRNPMLVRELRFGLISRGTLWIRMFYGAFFAYFMLGVAVTFERTSFEDTRVWLLAQIFVTVAVAPSLVANALTKEYELGNIDMLRMTLLRPRDIVMGKGLAGFMAVIPMVGAACCSALPLLSWDMSNIDVMIMGYVTLFVCALVSVSLGLTSSLIARRTTSALIMGYVLNLIVFAGISFVSQLLLHGSLFVNNRPDPAVAMLSPIRSFFEYAGSWAESGAPPAEWMTSMALFTLVGIGLTYVALAAFARFRMQDV